MKPNLRCSLAPRDSGSASSENDPGGDSLWGGRGPRRHRVPPWRSPRLWLRVGEGERLARPEGQSTVCEAEEQDYVLLVSNRICEENNRG